MKDEDGQYAYEFINESAENDIPKEYINVIDQGIQDQMHNGVLAGHRLMGIRAILVGGSFHETDSSDMAFKIAASMALREAVLSANPALLEPVMTVEVVTPEDYMGDIIGDLNSRRGNVSGMDQRGNARVINAMVPLANMFGYVNTLRSMSQGRSQYTMHFDHYERVPQAVADEVTAKMA